ncbi:MAG: hypothetical protein K9K63_18770 [Desulfotignum sp.]|nr:hypothetical protein [Desulfotignum sp.]MCF8089615.1 hypothetical protein [Desulfotignum sp.]MCF8139345.1 hypothetical protein [Desulfotignum sp.]
MKKEFNEKLELGAEDFLIKNPIELFWILSRQYLGLLFETIKILDGMFALDIITGKYRFFVLRGDNIDQLLYEGRVDLKMVEEARKADQIMILYTIDTAKDAFKKTV